MLASVAPGDRCEECTSSYSRRLPTVLGPEGHQRGRAQGPLAAGALSASVPVPSCASPVPAPGALPPHAVPPTMAVSNTHPVPWLHPLQAPGGRIYQGGALLLIYIRTFLLIDLRERGQEREVCCSTYSCICWLTLVCAAGIKPEILAKQDDALTNRATRPGPRSTS